MTDEIKIEEQIDETVERMGALLAKALNDLRYNS